MLSLPRIVIPLKGKIKVDPTYTATAPELKIGRGICIVTAATMRECLTLVRDFIQNRFSGKV